MNMRKFFSLSYSPEGECGNALELVACNIGVFDYLLLKKGKRLGRIPDTVNLRVAHATNAQVSANIICEPYGWIIVSRELAKCVLQIAPDDIEILNVPIYDESGSPLRKEFFALNALKMLDVISEVKTVRSSIPMFDEYPILKLGIVRKRVPENVRAFRVLGEHSTFVVDQVLRDAVCELPHEGLAFSIIDSE